MKPLPLAFASALALGASLAAAAAQEPAGEGMGRIAIELNKLEPAEDACRAYLVVDNEGEALETLSLDLVMFDPEGVIAKRLAVEAGPLREGKTAVKAFTVDEAGCETIDRVLLNDVLACAGEAGPREGCLDRIEVSSRADAAFID